MKTVICAQCKLYSPTLVTLIFDDQKAKAQKSPGVHHLELKPLCYTCATATLHKFSVAAGYSK